MIPMYNPRPDYLEQALRSVLMQDPGSDRMQIEVVDDCSTNIDVSALVKGIAGDRVTLSRNVKNLGQAGNLNNCIDRSNGVWVHILHYDDYVLPGFYELLEETQRAHPEVSLIATRSFLVDADGLIEQVTPRVRSLEKGGHEVQGLFYKNPIYTPAVVVRKSFYEQHGRFRTDLPYALDMELWVRIISTGGGVILPQILACYRSSAGNITSRYIRSAEALQDEWRLSRIFNELYPNYDLKRADQIHCRYAFARAKSYAQNGDLSAANANLKFWKEHASISLRLELFIKSIVRRAARWIKR
jgi:glycosyltransferase involved in cell wall biosynthesis